MDFRTFSACHSSEFVNCCFSEKAEGCINPRHIPSHRRRRTPRSYDILDTENHRLALG